MKTQGRERPAGIAELVISRAAGSGRMIRLVQRARPSRAYRIGTVPESVVRSMRRRSGSS